jgi:hypothetical protein
MKLTGTSKPKARIMARVIRADGEIVDLGTICGEGQDAPENVKKRDAGRAHLKRLCEKEVAAKKPRRKGVRDDG